MKEDKIEKINGVYVATLYDKFELKKQYVSKHGIVWYERDSGKRVHDKLESYLEDVKNHKELMWQLEGK